MCAIVIQTIYSLICKLRYVEDQNPWWNNEEDPILDIWDRTPIKWKPSILEEIDIEQKGLHFLIGPRQVGKTTSLKLLIREQLKRRDNRSVFYFSCDEILDHQELGEILDTYLSIRNEEKIKGSLIILNEITYVDNWWRSINSRIDRGLFLEDVLIVIGSTSLDLLGHVETFPGRRGKGKDHFMHPLSFSEFCDIHLKKGPIKGSIDNVQSNSIRNKVHSDKLKNLWKRYLATGGFPRPIIDEYVSGIVSYETGRSFLNWMKGDWNKAGKNDPYMKEVIRYLIRARGSPISYNSLSTQTSLKSPHTARSYIDVLKGMFVVNILELITADGRVDHKKNRKVHFTDPYVYHSLSKYINEEIDQAWLIEGTSASLIGRDNGPYYFRNGTESDIVILRGNDQIGFEITRGVKKWRKPWHLKEAYKLDRNNIHLFLASIR